MLDAIWFSDVVFNFGTFLVITAIVIGAWRSTYIPGQQQITVVVFQHSSGLQTFQRFETSDAVDNTLPTTQQAEGDPVNEEVEMEDVETDEDGIIDDFVNVINETVQANRNPLVSAETTDAMTARLSDRLPSISNNNMQDSTIANNVLVSDQEPTIPNIAQTIDSSPTYIINNIYLNLDPHSDNDLSHDTSAETSFTNNAVSNTELDNILSVDVVPSIVAEDTVTQNPASMSSCKDPSMTSKEETSIGAVCADKSPVLSSHCTSDRVSQCEALASSRVTSNAVQESNIETPSISELTNKQGTSDRPTDATASTSSTSSEDVPCPEGYFRIRLKFIDDEQRIVFGKPAENVIGFKTTHFSSELSQHRVVRLIFQGKLLKPDTATLAQCGLTDNCVLHCHVSQPKPPPQVSPAAPNTTRTEPTTSRWSHYWYRNRADDDAPNTEGLDISNYVGGFLWIIVGVLWIIRFKHSYMFSTFSTFMLVFLTMLLVVPHYIFSLDVQFHVNMDTRTMRNLGVNRVVVLDQRSDAPVPEQVVPVPSAASTSGGNAPLVVTINHVDNDTAGPSIAVVSDDTVLGARSSVNLSNAISSTLNSTNPISESTTISNVDIVSQSRADDNSPPVSDNQGTCTTVESTSAAAVNNFDNAGSAAQDNSVLSQTDDTPPCLLSEGVRRRVI